MLDSEEFRNCVKAYVELHDEIASSTKHLSELRKKKDAIGQLIVEFMKNKGIDECELQDNGGKLVRRESKRTEALRKEHILNELLTLVGQDNTRAQTSLENIYGKRAVEIKETLSRTKR
jgi:hypothetical protein